MPIDPQTQRVLDRMDEEFMRPEIEESDALILQYQCEGSILPADLIGAADLDALESFDPDVQLPQGEGESDSAWEARQAEFRESESARILGILRGLADYIECPSPKFDSLDDWEWTVKRGGFLYRLSAPGYMDCTEWGHAETEQEAADSLVSEYGDHIDDSDDESGEES